jgi:triosephosphate isomerase
MTQKDGRNPQRPNAVIGVSLKSYFGYQQTLDWCAEVAALPAVREARAAGQIELFVLPSFPVLVPALAVLEGTGVRVGAQTVSAHPNGAHTGEVSAGTLAEIGCTHALVGHAERRRDCGESDDVVAAELAAALTAGLCPVLCVGEPEPVSGADAARFCQSQLSAALSAVPAADSGWHRMIVAYEPVWAIGAHQPAPHSHVRYVCGELSGWLAAQSGLGATSVIYGGAAGPGQLSPLFGPVNGLFLGRFAHQVSGLAGVLDDARSCLARPQVR